MADDSVDDPNDIPEDLSDDGLSRGGSGGSDTTASDVSAGLFAAFDAARAVPLSCLPPEELKTLVGHARVLAIQADAFMCAVTQAVGSADLPALENHRTVASLVSALTGAEPRTVAADVKLATWLQDFPVFAEAFATGQLSRRHLYLLRKAENPRTHLRLAEAQDYLLEAATGCSWKDFNHTLRYWVLAADPDGDEPKDQDAAQFVRAHKSADGTVSGSFHLNPLNGEAFLKAWNQRIEEMYRQDSAAESNVDDPAGRTSAQRKVDAFLELFNAGAARPKGKSPAPLVHLVMSEKLAEDLLARNFDEDGCGTKPSEALPLDPNDPDGRCELIDGTPIHPDTGIGLLATATLRRLILGADGEVLDLGRAVRTFPAKLKQALQASGRGQCRYQGCDAPIEWLEADHIIPFARNGLTNINNGQMLCGWHNQQKSDRIPEG